MSDPTVDPELRLELRFPPEWARIEPVRQAVRLCVAAMFGDDVVRDSIAMVCAELLENAVKYGRASASSVNLTLWQSREHIAIEVTNDVENESAHASALRDRIQWLRGFEDTAQAYMAALAEVYAQPAHEDVASGLGIVRIAYEGGCTVDCDVSRVGSVTVRARCGALPAIAAGMA
jgi:hypothetical protein